MRIFLRPLERLYGYRACGTLLLGAMCVAGALSGCSMFNGASAKQAVAQVDWNFAENAILIEVNANDQLNEYDGQAHTLLVGVFQVADPDAFRKLAADPVMLAQALGNTQPNSTVLQTVRYVVQPGRHAILSLDRAAKAKAVGLIAGYYGMDVKSSARLFEIPLAISDHKLIGHDYQAQPQTLALRLNLGPRGIEQALRLNPEPPEIASAKAKARAKQVIPLDGGGREILLTPANGSDAVGAAAMQLPN